MADSSWIPGDPAWDDASRKQTPGEFVGSYIGGQRPVVPSVAPQTVNPVQPAQTNALGATPQQGNSNLGRFPPQNGWGGNVVGPQRQALMQRGLAQDQNQDASPTDWATVNPMLGPQASQQPYALGAPQSPLSSEYSIREPNQNFVDSMSNAIWGQESGKGKNTKTSSTGAVGDMQIEPPTFNMWAKPGEDINKSADNIAVGRRIISSYANQYSNDPSRVAVAYFSGPGNVAPAGSPTPWIHDVNDGKVSTSQYVNQVLARLGGKDNSQGQPSAQNVQNAPSQQNSTQQQKNPTTPMQETEQQKNLKKLMLLRMAYPQHVFEPIDYDPWAVFQAAKIGNYQL